MTVLLARPDCKALLVHRARLATLVRQARQARTARLVRQGAMERSARLVRRVLRVIPVRRATPAFPVQQVRVV